MKAKQKWMRIIFRKNEGNETEEKEYEYEK